MKAEVFLKNVAVLGEGPLWDDRRGVLFFVDIEGKKLHRATMDGADTCWDMPSRIGTVGLTRSVTPVLPTASRLAVLLLMFSGRVGSMSVAMAVTRDRPRSGLRQVPEKILIG